MEKFAPKQYKGKLDYANRAVACNGSKKRKIKPKKLF